MKPLLFSVACLLAGCAAGVGGDSRYLQVVSNNRVVAEIDTGAGGMASCGNQLAMVKAHASVIARCVTAPSADSLPYSFVAHKQARESDGFKPSSPYLVRANTRASCRAMRDAEAKAEKTAIVKDEC